MVEPDPKTTPQAADARRWWLGLAFAADVGQLVVVLVASQGDGREAEVEIVDGMRAAIPEDVAASALGLTAATSPGERSAADGPSPGDSLALLARVREELTDLAVSVIENFTAQACVPAGRVLALGVLDPGVWTYLEGESGKGRSCFGLCDAARLAQRTGLNVIDAFAQRDLAGGGLGGPITALAQGVVLGQSPKTRLAVDLGRTTRLTLLGPTARGGMPQRVLAFDAGPGLELVDLLVSQLTGGEHRFDTGGRFAVQGSRIDTLVAQWLADPMCRQPPPHWRPRGVEAERFAAEANRLAIEQGWSVRDMVCTATHLVADVARQAAAHLPREAAIDEVIVLGRGQHNGMLLRELSQRFAPIPIVRLGELGIEIEAFDPACAAVLAMFFVDQTPGSLPEVTGVDMPRVLGRITPGSPKNWQRLLTAVGASRPAVRPLRSML